MVIYTCRKYFLGLAFHDYGHVTLFNVCRNLIAVLYRTIHVIFPVQVDRQDSPKIGKMLIVYCYRICICISPYPYLFINLSFYPYLSSLSSIYFYQTIYLALSIYQYNIHVSMCVLGHQSYVTKQGKQRQKITIQLRRKKIYSKTYFVFSVFFSAKDKGENINIKKCILTK